MKRLALMFLCLFLSNSTSMAQPKLIAKRSEAKAPLVIELSGLTASQKAALEAMEEPQRQ